MADHEPTVGGEQVQHCKGATNPRLNPAIAVEMSMRERDALMDADDWSRLVDKALATEVPTLGKAFWNGEIVPARVVTVVVGEAPVATWWCASLVGQERQAVEVTYHGRRFYLDNEDGSGWRKVTEGHGGPRWPHRSLPDSSALLSGRIDAPGDET